MKNKYFVIITGILLSLSFPPMIFNNLVFIAFIPLLQTLLNFVNKSDFSFSNNEQQTKNKRNYGLFFPLYLTFFIYHVGANWWIGSFQEQTDPYLLMSAIMLSIFHPFFFMFPIYMYIKFYNRFSKVNTSETNASYQSNNHLLYYFPLFWVAFEWLHGETELSYPWLTIGYTQITSINWIQYIDLSGIWGASLVILFINVLIFDLLNLFVLNNNTKVSKSENIINFIKTYKLKINFLFILILAPFLYSHFQINNYNDLIENIIKINKENEVFNIDKSEKLHSNKLITFGVVQPNINPWEKWSGKGGEQINTHLNLQDSLRNYFDKNNLIPKVDVFLWSETAIPYINMDFNIYKNLNIIYEDIKLKNYSLLTGFTDIYIYPDSNQRSVTSKLFDKGVYYESYNSAFMINKNEIPEFNTYDNSTFHKLENKIYHKMKLTPFAERLPHVEYIDFARNWFEWGVGISSWGKGVSQKVLQLNNNSKTAKIAPIICIESIYPRFVSNFANLGAEIFVVITNDAWYDGTPGPRQHYLIAAARAIENKRFLVRAANSGISGVISPIGTSLKELNVQQSSAFSYTVPKISNLTIYSKFKDWLPILTIILILSRLIFLKRK